MTFYEAIEYIHGLNRFGSKLGLENTRELLRRMGDPQKKLRFVHVAGTNGKGSTAAYIAEIARKAGLRAGLFVSPYLTNFTERIQVDGVEIGETELASLTGAVREIIGDMVRDGNGHPTEFETVTAIAMAHYLNEGCDIVALEVGLGGRLDATNVIEDPLVSVITTIDFDHVKQLGGSLERIAREKAGIIKPGREVVVYPQTPGVNEVFLQVAKEAGAPIRICDFSSIQPVTAAEQATEQAANANSDGEGEGVTTATTTAAEADAGFGEGEGASADAAAPSTSGLRSQVFNYKGYKNLRIGMLGKFQLQNAALAIEAIEAINRGSGAGKHGVKIPERAIREGLAAAKQPGRFEILRESPPFIVDVAHNAQCARALLSALREYFPGTGTTFVFGMLKDKDHAAVIDVIAPVARNVFTVTPDNPRALPADELAQITRERAPALTGRVEAFDSVARAVDAALFESERDGSPVCSFGSFYFAGEARAYAMNLFIKG